jgi:hypothetical protein
MAAMEILSWTTVLFTTIYLILDHFDSEQEVPLVSVKYGYAILAFIGLCSLGVFINAPQDHWVRDMGALRDFLLFFFFFYSLKIYGDVKKLFLIMVFCSAVVSIYGIWQHFSGIDLWRHNHRALVQIPWGTVPRYATVGFFNHHLTYAYSFGMLICISWALLLSFKDFSLWKKTLLTLAFFSVLFSIVCTYGRGAWIALAIAIPTMVFLSQRKRWLNTLILMAVIIGGLYKIDPTIRERINSLTIESYQSNLERRKLWQINFQMFKEHPLIGVGYLENENLSMSYYQKMNIPDGMAGHAHNNYFEFLSTAGALGFLAYLVVIFIPLYLSFKTLFLIKNEKSREALWDRCFVLASIGAQLVFHIGGFTQCTVCDSKVLHQFVFWLAVALYFRNKYSRIYPKIA